MPCPGQKLFGGHAARFDPLDDPTLFPHVEGWLESLQNGPRGADGDNFTQYDAALIAHGYKRIFHLARDNFTIEELQRVCGNDMTEGLAHSLLEYAKHDTAKIVKEESDRQRRQRVEPRRYL